MGEAGAAAHRPDPRGRRRLRAREHGVFEHVLVATGTRGSPCPRSCATTRASCMRTSRTTTPSRCASSAPGWPPRPSGGMRPRPARASRRCGGASRVQRPLNVPRPLLTKRGLAGFHRAARRRTAAELHDLLAPSYPRGREWDGRSKAVDVPRRVARERRRPGDLRHRVPPAATGTIRCSRRLVEEHELATVDGWIGLAPDATVPALTDGERTLARRGRRRPVGVSGGRHADGRALRRPRLREDDVVHAERTARVAARRAARRSPVARCSRALTVVAARARRSDGRVGLALDLVVPPADRVPARLGGGAARRARARRRHGARPGIRRAGAARAGRSLFYARAWLWRRCSRMRCCRVARVVGRRRR